MKFKYLIFAGILEMKSPELQVNDTRLSAVSYIPGELKTGSMHPEMDSASHWLPAWLEWII